MKEMTAMQSWNEQNREQLEDARKSLETHVPRDGGRLRKYSFEVGGSVGEDYTEWLDKVVAVLEKHGMAFSRKKATFATGTSGYVCKVCIVAKTVEPIPVPRNQIYVEEIEEGTYEQENF